MKRLWQHCHAATLKGGKYSIVEDAALVTDGPLIHWIGPRAELPPGDYAERIDLGGAWLTPGLIRLPHPRGVRRQPQRRIRAAPGGRQLRRDRPPPAAVSPAPVRATREASEEELLASARKRLEPLLRDGVTALEIKSGYGLDLASERKMLRVIRRLGERLPATVRSTCLAAPCATAGIRRARRRLHRAYLLDDAPRAGRGGTGGRGGRLLRAPGVFPGAGRAGIHRRPRAGPAGEAATPSSYPRCTVPAWRRATGLCRPTTWST
ncbi:imidazolonepropionase [Pseudomonas aeruginosa]|nr:imidazolonepropionase [Pseudomonas aeruginosa]